MPNYDGLTRNQWPGTWSPSSNHPIVLDTEIRGGLRYISGDSGDRLSNIPGQRLQEGMLVYIDENYVGDSASYDGGKYYQYSLQELEERDANTGNMPNSAANWSEFSLSGSAIELDSSAVEASVAGLLSGTSEDLTNTIADQVIDTFDKTLYRTIKYIVQIEHDENNKYHSTELLLTHNGSEVYFTEYASVTTDSDLGTFSAAISANTVSLLFSPEYSNTSIKSRRININS